MRRTVTMAGLGLALLAGCGQAVPDSVARDYAERHATSSHLVNKSDVPITVTVGDVHTDITVPPGEEVTNQGGAWLVPRGWRCRWVDTGTPDTVPPTVAGSDAYDAWTTYGGNDQTILSCTPPAS